MALTCTMNYAQLGLNWQELGPNDVGGRSRSVVYDKTDINGKTIYAGSVSGGLFKSTDGGASWVSVGDQSGVFNISCMSQAANGNLYIGTGERFFFRNMYAYKSNAFAGTGLYMYSPSSNSFTLVKDSSLFGDVNEVATHPTNAQLIYVAATKGFFISNDGGATFTAENNNPAQDVKVGIDGTVYYVSGDYTTTNNKVYRSSSGNPGSFTDITPTSTSNPNINQLGRIEIAVAPSDANYVYLLISNTGNASTTNIYSPRDQPLNAVYGSNDKGNTWVAIVLGSYGQFDIFQQFYGINESGGTQYNYYGGFSNTIKVHPTDPKHIYIGGYIGYEWVQNPNLSFGNGTWTQMGYYSITPLHNFIHDISFRPGNPSEYVVATNGGIYKGFVNGSNTSFLPANRGFNVTQFNSVNMVNYPVNIGSGSTIIPVGGVMGGAVNEGPLFIKGSTTNSLTMNSMNFVAKNAYSMEFSKINNKVAFASFDFGSVQRNTNIYTSAFANFTDIYYSSAVATSGTKISFPSFAGINTPMALWENWGQLPPVDSTLLWNVMDTLTYKINTAGNTKKKFVFSFSRPQKNAYYDVAVVRTAPTKAQAISSPSKSYTIGITYTGTLITNYSFTGTGYDNTSPSNHKIFLGNNLSDSITITLNYAPMNMNNDSVIMLVLGFRYNAGDYVYGYNKDLGFSNYSYVDSIQLTAPLSYTGTVLNNVVKIPSSRSARLAVGIKNNVMFSKRALNTDISPPWIKIAGSKSRIDSTGGIPGASIVPVKGDVTNLQWAPGGTELYFSTYDATGNAYYLYRISHLGFIGDDNFQDYSGYFTSDIDSAYKTIQSLNIVAVRTGFKKNIPIRTTALGKFNAPITSISVSNDNKTVLITLGGYSVSAIPRIMVSNGDARFLNYNPNNASNFVDKTGNFGNMPVYASTFIQQDNNKVLIGTENGVYSTSNITNASPTWVQENNSQLPKVPVYQLRQQTLSNGMCYNSGYIYAATYGRGIWATSNFAVPYVVSVNEIQNNKSDIKGLMIYPNPANDYTKVQFNLPEGMHQVNLVLMDITGKIITSETTKVNSTGGVIEMEINAQSLIPGIYIIQVKTNDFVKSGKLIIAK